MEARYKDTREIGRPATDDGQKRKTFYTVVLYGQNRQKRMIINLGILFYSLIICRLDDFKEPQ